MCSRRARNRAREFCDQAFCAIKVREGRGSALQTAHSTAFSVISDPVRVGRSLGNPCLGPGRSASMTAGCLLERSAPFIGKLPIQPDGRRIGSRAGSKGRTPVRVDGGSTADGSTPSTESRRAFRPAARRSMPHLLRLNPGYAFWPTTLQPRKSARGRPTVKSNRPGQSASGLR